MENEKNIFFQKIIGWALISGSLLSFIGNAIHPNLPEEKSLDASSFFGLVQNGQFLWYSSHLLLFAIIPIILFGIIGVCILLFRKEEHVFALFSLLSFGFWAVLNANLIIIDGFVIPDIIAINNVQNEITTATFNLAHFIVLNGLSFSLFLWSLGFTFLGLAILRTHLFGPIIYWSGLAIGTSGVVGYIFGMFGRYWVLGNIFTLFAIIFTIWIFILGINVVRLGKE